MTRIGLVVTATAVLAACSTGPSGPQVAALGGTTTTTTAPAAGGGRSGNEKGAQDALKFSACMRSHGVRNFPDPTISGNSVGIQMKPGNGIDPTSATFQNAQKACQPLLQQGIANGVKADPTKIAPWAACIRSHGLPHFPDPTVNSDGAMQLNLEGTGVDPGGSVWQKAVQACRSLSPGGGMMVRAAAGPGGGK